MDLYPSKPVRPPAAEAPCALPDHATSAVPEPVEAAQSDSQLEVEIPEY
jgi:hypothetical protein